MKTNNPIFKKSVRAVLTDTAGIMTIQGALNKTGILTLILIVTAVIAWNNTLVKIVPSFLIPCALFGFGLGVYIIFNPKHSPLCAPIYAALEGAVLGSISAIYEMQSSGIILKAVMITLSILLTMLIIYRLKIIKVTDQFYRGIVAATGGVCLIYIADILLNFFGVNIPYLHEGGWPGILISLVIIGIASMNLILDFHNIELMAEKRVSKYMEWYGAFGIIVTLIWLYLEVLRLLNKK